MGSTTDKIKGSTNEAIGKAKKGVGEAVGSDRLQGEGMMQEAKGHGQKAVGGAKQAASRQRLDDLFQSMLHRAFNGEL